MLRSLGSLNNLTEEVTESYLCFRGISLWHYGKWLGRGKMGDEGCFSALRRVWTKAVEVSMRIKRDRWVWGLLGRVLREMKASLLLVSSVDHGRWCFLPKLEIEGEGQGLVGGKQIEFGGMFSWWLLWDGAIQKSVGSSRRWWTSVGSMCHQGWAKSQETDG